MSGIIWGGDLIKYVLYRKLFQISVYDFSRIHIMHYLQCSYIMVRFRDDL
jgi:hypothetical protein